MAMSGEDRLLQSLCPRIRTGQVIPIIANSVRNDRIFDVDRDRNLGPSDGTPSPHVGELNVEEELAEKWAQAIGYPLPDKHRLARVAVYNQVRSFDEGLAKAEYLRFLKEHLLRVARRDPQVVSPLEELQSQLDTLSFSEIASQLGYPRFSDQPSDPLRLLARLPLAIYVTTSYYDFMERALQLEERSPRTQICFLRGEPLRVDPEHRVDPDFVPNPEQPLVYHLHGFEQYPESLVLSEDDYLDFLVRVSEEGKDTIAPMIPLYLSGALAESSLLLLGYRLQDWDFRVLFRGLITAKHDSLRKVGLAIQLDPEEQREITDTDTARWYLREYFAPAKFHVVWGNTDRFVERLDETWGKWRTDL